MAKIDQLSKNGQAIYPVTHESAVLDSNGVSIDRKMNEANDKINGKAEQQYVDEELGKVNSQLETNTNDLGSVIQEIVDARNYNGETYKWDKIIQDSTTGDHAAELIDARYGPNDTEQHPTLGHRLNHISKKQNLADICLEDLNNNKASKNQNFPRDFGAIGDGITNDYQSLDKLIKNSDIIDFEKNAIYFFDRPLVFEDLHNKIINGNGATLLYKGEEYTNQENGGVFQFNRCSNIKIFNLNINVNGEWISRPYNYEESYKLYDAKRNKFKDAFYMDNCKNIIIENCLSTKCRVGYFITNSQNIRLNKNTSYKTMADSFFITGACKEVNVCNHYSELVNDDCNSICGFRDNNDDNPNNCHIHDNIAKNCFGTGATLQSARNCTIKNCISIDNRDIPIKLGGYLNTQLSENCSIEGITVITSNIIQGNFEQDISKHCSMHLGKNKNCKLKNSNIIRYNANQPAIENIMVGVEGISLENNNIEGYEFIIAGSSRYINVINNTLTTNGTPCINESNKINFNGNTVTINESYTERGRRVLALNNSFDIEVSNNIFNSTTFSPIGIYSDKGIGNIKVDSDDAIEISNSNNMAVNIFSSGIISINNKFTGLGRCFKNNQLIRNIDSGELFFVKDGILNKLN